MVFLIKTIALGLICYYYLDSTYWEKELAQLGFLFGRSIYLSWKDVSGNIRKHISSVEFLILKFSNVALFGKLLRLEFLWIWANFMLFLIAALISAGYYCAPIFYNSKNLNCIGALSFFLRSVHTFSWFLKSNWSSDFGHAETGNGAKKRVVLRREFFLL